MSGSGDPPTLQTAVRPAETTGRKVAVLFVDDESSVLDGLRRMLRREREQWDLRFAVGPQEALRELERQPADVVVSDFRMPGMTGSELLAEVQRRWPRCVRIILSGDCQKATVFQVAGVAHRFLAKPCPPEVLKQTIIRSTALRGVLNNERIGTVVTALESLPTLPAIYQELRTVLAHPQVTVGRVGRIVAQDAGLTAAVLKVANSAYLGLNRTVEDAVEAVSILGLEVVGGLALSTKVFESFSLEQQGGFDLQELSEHQQRVALMAPALVKAQGGGKAQIETAYTAGILHDIGFLVCWLHLGGDYQKMLTSARRHRVHLHVAEEAIFQADHGEVGGFLLSLWGISEPVVDAVALHHVPQRIALDDPLPLAAVHVADVVDSRRYAVELQRADLRIDFLKQAEYDAMLPEWLRLCQEILDRGSNRPEKT